MFCSHAAKIVAGISGGCTLCGILFSVIIPYCLFSNVASQMDDHVDGSHISFSGGELQVSVTCTRSDRNMPWAIFVDGTETCEDRAAAISVTGPPQLQPVPLDLPIPVHSRCESEPPAPLSAAMVGHVPSLIGVASFFPTQDRVADVSGRHNYTTRTGTYTINCGTSPCWVVDALETRDAVVQATAQATNDVFLSAAVGGVCALVGTILLVSAFILWCVAGCIVCCSERPIENRKKGLMDEEEGESE